MTTLALSLLHRTPTFLQKIGGAVSAFFEGVDDARRLSRKFNSLARLSDAELAQRGLKREDIARIVLGNAHS